MTEHKSKRNRKVIDYSKFGNGEDDDDFRDDTPPPTKKAKKSDKPSKKVPKIDTKIQEQIPTQSSRPKTDRTPPEEKHFDRELQLALEMSMQEIHQPSQTSLDCDTSDQEAGGESLTVSACIETNHPKQETDFDNAKNATSSGNNRVMNTSGSRDVSFEDADVIEIIEQDIIVVDKLTGSTKCKRQAATKAKQHWKVKDDDNDDDDDGDSEFMETNRKKTKQTAKRKNIEDSDGESWQSSPDLSSDEADWAPSEDIDSDFDAGGSNKTGKNKADKGQKKIAESVKKKKISENFATETSATVLPQKKIATPSSRTVGAKKPASASINKILDNIKENGILTSNKAQNDDIPKRTPGIPALCRKSTTVISGIRSTSSPKPYTSSCSINSPPAGLRLGLSKKARIKSLHPSVKLNVTH